MATLEKYRTNTPPGIEEMLGIKGFGPKKVKAVWDELQVESIGELLYAVNENRLVELKGFGQKTQEDLKKKLEYYQKSKNKFLYATLEQVGTALIDAIKKELAEAWVEFTGAMRRRCNVVEKIEIIIGYDEPFENRMHFANLTGKEQINDHLISAFMEEFPVLLYHFPKSCFGSKQFLYTGNSDFVQKSIEQRGQHEIGDFRQEEEVFKALGMSYVPPERRETGAIVNVVQQNALPELLKAEDVLGVIHAHTTYSDGGHSLEQMANFARELGYHYIGITDHSRSAFYANGLQPERVLQQMEEIDILNRQLAPFKIFKGIESDILNDGQLDYEDDLLQRFDFIIASVHTNLRMDKEKATQRIIKAIENPFTTILGHPSGRLLLSREGYPLDYKKVIDACAANGVSIELNANPYRLDLDWQHLPYTLEKGVKVSVNPDAHTKDGIKDIRYGVWSARKGGLTKDMCINCLDAAGFEELITN